jgi:(E)-4-hydroxy-3-methyl-but-2-enyl pyrophosphate reductase
MKYKIAKHAGFCFGVRRAVENANATLADKAVKQPVYSLGHLVHNTKVVSELESKGIKVIESLEEIDDKGSVIISAHGVSPQIVDEVKEKGLDLIDTTCTQVQKVQKLAKQLNTNDYFVVIVGDKNHPEVKGVKEWAGSKSLVVSNVKDLKDVNYEKKIGVISQTTVSVSFFNSIVDALSRQAKKEINVHNTVCNATSTRQKEAEELAREVDLMLVLGDTKSANTKRLYEISKKILFDTYLITGLGDIEDRWLIGKKLVGITAGASTPHSVIDEVLGFLEEKHD